jgi:hypothetical protein
MAVLDQLTLAAATPKKDNTPLGRFRRRLVEALDVQLDIANADSAGTVFTRSRQRWVKNEAGGKELVSVPVRFKRWWWKDDAGKTYLSLRSGARLLEIAPGKKAIEVGSITDLPAKLAILREAVCAGELDSCSSVKDASPGRGNRKGKPEAALARTAPVKV